MLGQGLAEGAGPVGDGAAADLAADEGQVGDGDREAAGICLTHFLLLCHLCLGEIAAAVLCVPGQMTMPAGRPVLPDGDPGQDRRLGGAFISLWIGEHAHEIGKC